MREHRLTAAAACAALIVVAGCSASDVKDAVTPDQAPKEPITLTPNVEQKASGVKVSTRVKVLAENGEISRATLTTVDKGTTINGRVGKNGWTAAERLEPSTTYRLRAEGTGEDGRTDTVTRTFTTQALSLAEQTYPSVAPLQGETVGVGMPVIVTFDVPVKNRSLYEKHMQVTTNKDVEGSWTWFSDREAHYRPEKFWPAHTRVKVDLTLNSLPAGGGVYGQQDQKIDFKVGKKAVTIVNVAQHRLSYTVDNEVVRKIPVTTGDDTHRTREGIKVIMEKFSSVDMDAATTGVDSEDPGYYNISDVRWAMRVTNSGEFLHAAPWSVASQGNANVSHGCTGMSTANAKWLYDNSRRGDVVKYVNSPRPLEDRNGWTDWNVPWSEWTSGSALEQEPIGDPEVNDA
ncbi:L,D-transpeptidase [Aeromicrobium stalagmiti]|uniref:L,D-transpeptidase n=1 Tax=Aeromicrobium stalagmiti TaxID=2738988 RepID=UPI003464D9D5